MELEKDDDHCSVHVLAFSTIVRKKGLYFHPEKTRGIAKDVCIKQKRMWNQMMTIYTNTNKGKTHRTSQAKNNSHSVLFFLVERESSMA